MAKYKIYNKDIGDLEIQALKVMELNHIANELAEANRLKRLELDLKSVVRQFSPGPDIQFISQDELEDKA